MSIARPYLGTQGPQTPASQDALRRATCSCNGLSRRDQKRLGRAAGQLAHPAQPAGSSAKPRAHLTHAQSLSHVVPCSCATELPTPLPCVSCVSHKVVHKAPHLGVERTHHACVRAHVQLLPSERRGHSSCPDRFARVSQGVRHRGVCPLCYALHRVPSGQLYHPSADWPHRWAATPCRTSPVLGRCRWDGHRPRKGQEAPTGWRGRKAAAQSAQPFRTHENFSPTIVPAGPPPPRGAFAVPEDAVAVDGRRERPRRREAGQHDARLMVREGMLHPPTTTNITGACAAPHGCAQRPLGRSTNHVLVRRLRGAPGRFERSPEPPPSESATVLRAARWQWSWPLEAPPPTRRRSRRARWSLRPRLTLCALPLVFGSQRARCWWRRPQSCQQRRSSCPSAHCRRRACHPASLTARSVVVKGCRRCDAGSRPPARAIGSADGPH